jgi:pyruvate kinase
MAIGRVMQKPYATVTSMGEVNQKRRKTKMSFKQRLRNWLYDDSADEPIAITRDENDLREEQSINFSVIPAAGGRIVQVRTYDQRTDRNSNKLHIITPDENLAESLAQILQIEQLSR